MMEFLLVHLEEKINKMRDNKNKGIVNLLNLPNRSPVRTQKVETQVAHEKTFTDHLLDMEPLNLPKTKPEKKDEFGYTKKQNRIIDNQLTRPKLKNKELEIAEKQWTKVAKQPNYNGKYFQNLVKKDEAEYQRSLKASKDVVDTYNKYEDGPNIQQQVIDYSPVKVNKRFVNKTLNKFENRTDNKDVVTFDPTTQLFTDETRNIAFKSYDQAKRWNDVIEKPKEMRKTESTQTNKPKRYI
jgi:hypothetical protein